MKLRSTEILQSHIRSYLVRKKKKNEERVLFDQMENGLALDVLLTKFLFFYNAKEDQGRKVSHISQVPLCSKIKSCRFAYAKGSSNNTN